MQHGRADLPSVEDVLQAGRRLAAAAEVECAGLERQLRERGLPFVEVGVSERALPAVAVLQMSADEVVQELKKAELQFRALLDTSGWSVLVEPGVHPAQDPSVTVGKLGVLRTRLDNLLAQESRGPRSPAPTPLANANAGFTDPGLVPGVLAEVQILSGRHAGSWVDCTVHKVDERNQTYTVHVLATRRYDQAVGQSNRIVPEVAPQFVRRKTTQRIVPNGRYLSIDSSRKWWPVTVTGENLDGTYSAVVHDGAGQPKVWPAIHADNIKGFPIETAGSPAPPHFGSSVVSPRYEDALSGFARKSLHPPVHDPDYLRLERELGALKQEEAFLKAQRRLQAASPGLAAQPPPPEPSLSRCVRVELPPVLPREEPRLPSLSLSPPPPPLRYSPAGLPLYAADPRATSSGTEHTPPPSDAPVFGARYPPAPPVAPAAAAAPVGGGGGEDALARELAELRAEEEQLRAALSAAAPPAEEEPGAGGPCDGTGSDDEAREAARKITEQRNQQRKDNADSDEPPPSVASGPEPLTSPAQKHNTAVTLANDEVSLGALSLPPSVAGSEPSEPVGKKKSSRKKAPARKPSESKAKTAKKKPKPKNA